MSGVNEKPKRKQLPVSKYLSRDEFFAESGNGDKFRLLLRGRELRAPYTGADCYVSSDLGAAQCNARGLRDFLARRLGNSADLDQAVALAVLYGDARAEAAEFMAMPEVAKRTITENNGKGGRDKTAERIARLDEAIVAEIEKTGIVAGAETTAAHIVARVSAIMVEAGYDTVGFSTVKKHVLEIRRKNRGPRARSDHE